ncbi:MAG: hypothetical protein C0614_11660 [Desulfuromonas sp.]|nr:MAG: hypothetical protein C0614_11660 [Desulfuromonas sp.]
MSFARKDRKGMSRRRFLSLGGLALGAGMTVHSAWYEPRAVETSTHRLPASKPGGPVRLVQVSDLHLSRFDRYFREVIELIDGLRPDLIVLTGDYLEEERNIRGVLDFLKALHAPHGIYAVQGNWEYWSRLEGENLRRHFAGTGVTLLINERVDLEIRGRGLAIYGLDYPSSADFLNALQRQVDPERYNFLLSHVPAFAHEQLNRHIDLVLCGHTHGVQVRLPYLPPFYLPRFSGRFVSGFYRVSPHRIPLYVNRGIGTSILPMRLLCRPEISVFDLAAA